MYFPKATQMDEGCVINLMIHIHILQTDKDNVVRKSIFISAYLSLKFR